MLESKHEGEDLVPHGHCLVPHRQVLHLWLDESLGWPVGDENFQNNSHKLDGSALAWAFYGYSPIYGGLIGIAEMLPAILLALRRTGRLGASVVLPIALNMA
jgi:hypothetical protein